MKVPFVIDFDLKNEKGEKDTLLKWPKTYAVYSQDGKGIHLYCMNPCIFMPQGEEEEERTTE